MKKLSAEYKSLSKDELYLISRIEYEKKKLITTEYVRKLFGNTKKAANILNRLTRKERLIQIEKGKYILVPIKAPNQLWVPNEFTLAKLWMGDIPYYIGYFTMYNYWGFTEQVPQTVFVLNTKKSRTKIIGSVRFKAVKIDKRKYYGIKEVRIEDETVCISDRERTLVDFIYNPIGSFQNVKQVMDDNLRQINLNKYVRYLISFPVISVRKRAGYILEQLNCRDLHLKRIQRTIGSKKTYSLLDPSKPSRKGKLNKDWGLIING
jgi:predicted transcriptional regulator of viral defense system